MFTFTPKTYADKRIDTIRRRTQGTFVIKQAQYFLALSLMAVLVTQFACAKPVPVRFEYMDMV